MTDTERALISNLAFNIMSGTLDAEEIHADAEEIHRLATKPDWTPCAEGLPKKVDFRLWSRNVLATVEQETGERYVIEAYYHYGHEKWKHDHYEDFYVGEVIAWKNIPAPYRADQKEDAE